VHPRLGTRWVVVVASVALLVACGQHFQPVEDPPAEDASTEPDGGARPDVTVGTDALEESTEGGGEIDATSDVADEPDHGSTDASDPRCGTCAAYGDVKGIAPLPMELGELSGIAASYRHPGFFYAHNDSGDTARFFVVGDEAEVEAELDLRGAVATDWEDVAVGPCGTASCIYIGDIGDNNAVRTQYGVFRAVEPDELPDGGKASDIAYEQFPFVYPDGPHNAETLLVHPATGRVFVVTKVGGAPSTVYELPLPLQPNVVATLVKIGPVSVPASAGLVTSGAFHPCSPRLLLRTYGALFEMTSTDGSPESLFAAHPVQVPAATEPQGEGVTYGSDGRSYYTAGETVASMPRAMLSVVACP
jgi:hypothetical protein